MQRGRERGLPLRAMKFRDVRKALGAARLGAQQAEQNLRDALEALRLAQRVEEHYRHCLVPGTSHRLPNTPRPRFSGAVVVETNAKQGPASPAGPVMRMDPADTLWDGSSCPGILL